jgi:hypothetical protein
MTAYADGCFPGMRSVPPGSRTIVSLRDGSVKGAVWELPLDLLACSPPQSASR